jgi:hypothetical protein
VAFGVIYHDPAPTYESGVADQLTQARKGNPHPELMDLLAQGGTWEDEKGEQGTGKREQ